LPKKEYLKLLQSPVNSRIEQEKQSPAAQKKLFQEFAHEEKHLERGFAKKTSVKSDNPNFQYPDDTTPLVKVLKAMGERAKSVVEPPAEVVEVVKPDIVDDDESGKSVVVVEKPSLKKDTTKKKQKNTPAPKSKNNQNTEANVVITVLLTLLKVPIVQKSQHGRRPPRNLLRLSSGSMVFPFDTTPVGQLGAKSFINTPWLQCVETWRQGVPFA
jgi:hypothetical protein